MADNTGVNAGLQKVADRWDSSASVYSYYSAKVFHGTALKLFDWVEGHQSTNILELGSGEAHSSIDFAIMKKPESQLYCVDISRNMSALALHRMRELETLILQGQILGYRNKLLSKLHTREDITNLPFKGPVEKISLLNVDIVHSAGEVIHELLPVGSIDALISSMCLHLTHEPQILLNQASQMLKPGAKAAFSLWGHKDKSLQYALVDRVKEEFGIEKIKRVSFFHLGENTPQLIDMFRTAGFKNVVVWEEHVPFPKHDPGFQAEEARTLLQWEWPEDKKAVLSQAISRLVELQNETTAAGHSIGLSVVCVGAVKAE